MKVGFAKLDISPRVPVTMGGYGDRKDSSRGILDHIYARTLVFEDGIGKRAVIVSVDIIELSKVQVKQIKGKINLITNISQDSIVVCTIHTHSGPLTNDNPLFGVADKDYVHWILEAIPESIVMALENLQSCKIGWYQGEFNEVGASRRALNKEVKTILTVLAAVDLNDNLIATIFNYNCHPTVLSADNLMVSADYPGAAIAILEQNYGDNVLFAFTNGACGDISTRFTRRGQNYQEVQRLGALLASEVMKAIGKIAYEEVSSISLKEKFFTLETRDIPNEETLNIEIEESKAKIAELIKKGSSLGDLRIAQTALQGIEIQKFLSKDILQLELDGYLNVIKIGKGAILTHPAEMFSSLGYEIMSNSPHNPTMIIGYTNGYIGYIPDRNSYNEGGYESLSCSFKVGEGEKLRDMAVLLLKEVE